jgi:hypothetical protein
MGVRPSAREFEEGADSLCRLAERERDQPEMRLRRYENAVVWLEEAQKLHPDDPEVRELLRRTIAVRNRVRTEMATTRPATTQSTTRPATAPN